MEQIFYVNLTLTNQSKIIDYDIYREKFPIKNVLFTNYSPSYFIMSLIMNDYFEGDFAGFYLISINEVNLIKGEKCNQERIGNHKNYKYLYITFGVPYINLFIEKEDNQMTEIIKKSFFFNPDFATKLRKLSNLNCLSNDITFTVGSTTTIPFSSIYFYDIKFINIDSLSITATYSQTFSVKNGETYLYGYEYYVTSNTARTYTLEYILHDGNFFWYNDYLSCSLQIKVEPLICPNLIYTFTISRKFSFKLNEQPYYVTNVFFDIIPNFYIQPESGLNNTSNKYPKGENFILLSNAPNDTYQINYSFISQNDATLTTCTITANILDFDCPIETISYKLNFELKIDFIQLSKYVDSVTIDGTNFTLSPISIDSTNTYPINTKFTISTSLTTGTFTVKYDLESQDKLIFKSCSFEAQIESFTCPIIDFTITPLTKVKIDLSQINDYVDSVTFNGYDTNYFSITSDPADGIPIDNPVMYEIYAFEAAPLSYHTIEYTVDSVYNCEINVQIVDFNCPTQIYELSIKDHIQIDFQNIFDALDLIKFSTFIYLFDENFYQIEGNNYSISSLFYIFSEDTANTHIIEYSVKSNNESISKTCSNELIIFSCDPFCLICNKGSTEEDHKCKKCSNNYKFHSTKAGYCLCDSDKYRLGDVCADSCPIRAKVNHDLMKCVNCQLNNQIFRVGDTDCSENITDNTIGYYFDINDPEDVTYGYYKKCHHNCLTCEKGGDDIVNNCLSCPADMILSKKHNCIPDCKQNDTFYFDGQCYSSCEKGLAIDITTNECMNCSSYLTGKKQFSYHGECLESLPSSRVFESDEYLNYYEDCYITCETCKASVNDWENNCTKCIDPLFLNYPDNTSAPSFLGANCLDYCEMQYVPNENTHQCERCTSYVYQSKCYNVIPDGFYSGTEPEKYLRPCAEMCETCKKPPDLTGNNCNSCKKGYKKIKKANNIVDCVSNCPNYLGEDGDECVNCQESNQVKRLEDISCTGSSASTYIIDTQYSIIKDCYKTCATCEQGGDDLNHNCKSCISPLFLTAKDGGNCVQSCHIFEVNENGVCINCANDSKVRFLNETFCRSKPENTYIVNSTYGIVKECYSTCKTCNGGSTSFDDQKCIDCKKNTQKNGANCIPKCKDKKYYYNGECLDQCPTSTYKNQANNMCEKCIGFIYKEDCYQTKPESTYLLEGTNILKDCHQNCMNCKGAWNDTVHNCTQCKIGLFLNKETDNCDLDCGSNLVKNYDEYTCKNCEEIGKYKYPNSDMCIDLPNGAHIIDFKYNLIEQCYSTCKNCTGQGDKDDHQCTECIPGYYKAYNSNNCIIGCPMEHYQNDSDMTCVNCHKSGKFKYLEQNECIDQPKSTVVIDNVNGIIQIAQQNVKIVKLMIKEIIVCPFCTDDLFFLNGQCSPSCGPNFHEDKTSRKCVNCKTEGLYKISSEDDCIEMPKNSYLIDNETNTLEYSYESCGECIEGGTLEYHICLSCKEGYTDNRYNASQCEINCILTHKKYILNEDKSYSCTIGPYCPDDMPYTVESDNQCVESCSPSSSCINCDDGTFFLDPSKEECVKNCPQGTFYDKRNYKCSLTGNNIPCQINILNTDSILSLEHIKENAYGYITHYLTETNKNVDIINGPNYTYEIFYENQCQKNISYDYNYSFIDMEKCEKIVKDKYPTKKVVFVKIDMRNLTNNNTPNQIEYVAIDENKNQIDLSICNISKHLNVSYPLLGKNKADALIGRKYNDIKIDIFNLEDSFFNDICYPYYTEENKDVVLKDRREYIYIQSYLCPLS